MCTYHERYVLSFSTAYDDVEGVTLKILIKGKSCDHTQNKKSKLSGAKRNEIGRLLSTGKCVCNTHYTIIDNIEIWYIFLRSC